MVVEVLFELWQDCPAPDSTQARRRVDVRDHEVTVTKLKIRREVLRNLPVEINKQAQQPAAIMVRDVAFPEPSVKDWCPTVLDRQEAAEVETTTQGIVNLRQGEVRGVHRPNQIEVGGDRQVALIAGIRRRVGPWFLADRDPDAVLDANSAASASSRSGPLALGARWADRGSDR